ncbi:Monooxygenase, FAD-binding [Penicillium griseofulvum]|uniref:Monooxygenase, FAD-binding n=1 Tax=Penicillium patulum TaxID=5078 RepID=A0A135LRC1_PENPA|nr:Monooxygenase, FAD-binding [Penicillium griseofulvum]KXG51510.1 Monooxygenase, FAD-binding [Penicillium griseofulvum]
MPLKILINGAGIAGTALANFLLRSKQGHDITIVERASNFRTGGTQLDLKSHGAPLMKKLGLIDAVRARSIHETAFTFVDTQGREWARFSVNETGKGYKGVTSEYEIMRADLVAVLYEGSKAIAAKASAEESQRLRYLFGKHAIEFTQLDSKVNVVFSDGSSDDYDLVVGADGQSSLTRRMLWEPTKDSDSTLKYTGYSVAYFHMPKSEEESDSTLFKNCLLPGPKVLSLRCAHKDFTQAMLTVSTTEELKEMVGQPVEKQKDLWETLFKDFGWESKRVLAEMRTAEDFYTTSIAQVKVDTLAKGRVVLVGDAGYCPSVLTGLGTTASLVGAYVLAGELARHGDNVSATLESYERVLQPYVEKAQQLPPMNLAIFRSKLGLNISYFALAILSKLRIDSLVKALTKDEKETWELPQYPELELEE